MCKTYVAKIPLAMCVIMYLYCRAADKVRCVKGEQMYKLNRDELKEMFGAGNGIRLYSQLQKDKARVRL